MFRTSYVHHQEDYFVHAALYGMYFIHLCKESSSRLLDKRQAFPNRITNQHVTSKIGKYASTWRRKSSATPIKEYNKAIHVTTRQIITKLTWTFCNTTSNLIEVNYLNTHHFNPNIIGVSSAKREKIQAASCIKSSAFLPFKLHFYRLHPNNNITGWFQFLWLVSLSRSIKLYRQCGNTGIEEKVILWLEMQ